MFEINLVPEIKEKAIKAIKLRNLIFFCCIVLVAACVAVLMVLFSIKGGQDIALAGKDNQLNSMSMKIKSFDDLDELLTVQAQLSELATLNSRKMTLSRIFNVIDTLLPTNGDVITISELNVNLAESTVAFDAQAQAKVDPFINYNVLNAFKQSMSMMRYDYGRYVDENGSPIPTLCLKESSKDGVVTAIWARGAKGCDPSDNESGAAASSSEAEKIFAEAEALPGVDKQVVTTYTGGETEEGGVIEATEQIRFVRIARVPKFNKWYNEELMDLAGNINGVEHFESACITYTGVDDGEMDGDQMVAKWSSENSCSLVPEEITITNSSDGRNTDGELVLRFSAAITFDPGVFEFANKHVITIGPTGKTDVTDSYVQIEGMFAERAEDCPECTNRYEEVGNGE